MSFSSRLAATAFVLAALVLTARCQAQEPPASGQVGTGITYEFIARWDVDRLNRILTVDTPAFAGVTATYTPAKNAVRLYKVTYPSVIPERANKPTRATGLLAVPEVSQTALPLVSYQHGTVYGKQQVPSYPEQSPETQLMIAQFAGQGYLLTGADYFGMGNSTEPEGYVVKGSHQQATQDMILAANAVLAGMKLTTTGLSLAGWSQGGYVTLALLERLEASGTPVRKAVTASAPVDLTVALNGFLDFPRPNDASWVTTLFILSAFSYKSYYSVPGLARSLIADEYYEVSRKAWAKEPVDASAIPTSVKALIKKEYFDPRFFANSAYGRLIAANQAYRWVVRTPVKTFYGETDEAISVGLGQLAATWQRALGNTTVEAVSTGPTSHRGTFAMATPQWKAWFDAP